MSLGCAWGFKVNRQVVLLHGFAFCCTQVCPSILSVAVNHLLVGRRKSNNIERMVMEFNLKSSCLASSPFGAPYEKNEVSAWHFLICLGLSGVVRTDLLSHLDLEPICSCAVR